MNPGPDPDPSRDARHDPGFDPNLTQPNPTQTLTLTLSHSLILTQGRLSSTGAHCVMRMSLTHSGLLASSSGCSSRFVISSAAACTRGHSCAAGRDAGTRIVSMGRHALAIAVPTSPKLHSAACTDHTLPCVRRSADTTVLPQWLGALSRLVIETRHWSIGVYNCDDVCSVCEDAAVRAWRGPQMQWQTCAQRAAPMTELTQDTFSKSGKLTHDGSCFCEHTQKTSFVFR